MKQMKYKQWLIAHLPKLFLLLILVQPLLDIFSYWSDQLALPGVFTLGLRFGLLLAVAIVGFLVTDNRRAYYILAACCGGYYLLHCLSCLYVGFLDPIGEFTNYIRVIQAPLFAVCFITFIRKNRGCLRAIETALYGVFAIITISVFLSWITGTNDATYYGSQIGVLGWFSNGNAQTAIFGCVSAICVMLSFRRTDKPWLFYTLLPLSVFQLVLMATRLAYFVIPVMICGLVLTAFLRREKRPLRELFAPRSTLGTLLVLVLSVAGCLAFLKITPMVVRANIHSTAVDYRQDAADHLISDALTEAEQDGELSDEEAEEIRNQVLHEIYEAYLPRLCERFGTERIMQEYGYSANVEDLMQVRQNKLTYCRLMMEELPFVVKLFGIERQRMYYHNDCFDPENDFHGIFYLYGAVGLVMMVAFLLYFVWRIIRCLRLDFKRFFTVEAAAFGMAFCLLIVDSIFTAGVLRRPNAVFYLSLVLAVIHVLSEIKEEECR